MSREQRGALAPSTRAATGSWLLRVPGRPALGTEPSPEAEGQAPQGHYSHFSPVQMGKRRTEREEACLSSERSPRCPLQGAVTVPRPLPRGRPCPLLSPLRAPGSPWSGRGSRGPESAHQGRAARGLQRSEDRSALLLSGCSGCGCTMRGAGERGLPLPGQGSTTDPRTSWLRLALLRCGKHSGHGPEWDSWAPPFTPWAPPPMRLQAAAPWPPGPPPVPCPAHVSPDYFPPQPGSPRPALVRGLLAPGLPQGWTEWAEEMGVEGDGEPARKLQGGQRGRGWLPGQRGPGRGRGAGRGLLSPLGGC